MKKAESAREVLRRVSEAAELDAGQAATPASMRGSWQDSAARSKI